MNTENRSRKTRLVLVVSAAAAGLLATALVIPGILSRAPRERPDKVVLILLDTVRADHLGCYGYAQAATKNIDKLAAAGARFVQAVSAIPETGPSVSSLFTGLYPINHGHRDNVTVLGDESVTLADILRRNGYETVAFTEAFPFYDLRLLRGFNHNAERPREAIDEHDNLKSKLKGPLAWLEENKDKKFFAFIHFFNAHMPYTPPVQSRRTASLNYHGPFTGDFPPVFGLWAKKIPIGEKDREFMVSLYDDEIGFLDQAVGGILDELKKMGLDRKTLIVLTADHGEALGEHDYYFDHGDLLYENQIRVPFIIRYPGMPDPGKTIEPQVRTVDLMPTILQVLNVKYSGMIDGASLLPLIHGKKASPGTGYAFSETDTISFANLNCRGYIEGVAGKHTSVRTDNFKLIYIPKRPEPLYELYDLKRDPRETTNIVGENVAEADELKRVLFRWLSRPRRPPTPREKLGEETQKILKSLGYIR